MYMDNQDFIDKLSKIAVLFRPKYTEGRSGQIRVAKEDEDNPTIQYAIKDLQAKPGCDWCPRKDVSHRASYTKHRKGKVTQWVKRCQNCGMFRTTMGQMTRKDPRK